MKTNITVPMIIALADLLNGAVPISGPAKFVAPRINVRTQRALISRRLATIVVGHDLACAVPVSDLAASAILGTVRSEFAAGMSKWLVIQPAGELVVSGYILGVETAEENATAML